MCVCVCVCVCVYLDVDSFDELCRVKRKSAAAVHREELLHLLQTLPEDTLRHTHTHLIKLDHHHVLLKLDVCAKSEDMFASHRQCIQEIGRYRRTIWTHTNYAVITAHVILCLESSTGFFCPPYLSAGRR